MAETFDAGLLRCIRERLPEGRFVIDSDSSAYFTMMAESLPVTSPQIAWDELPALARPGLPAGGLHVHARTRLGCSGMRRLQSCDRRSKPAGPTLRLPSALP